MAKTTTKAVEDALSSDGKSPQSETIAGFPLEAVSSAMTSLNILIYGESGVGKTVISGSASAVPEMSPVVLIDAEGGTLSLNAFYPETKILPIRAFKDWKGLYKIYSKLYDAFEKGETPAKTIIVDSLTEVQKISLKDIMAKESSENEKIDPDQASQSAWGKNLNQMRGLVRGFRDLPCSVIFTALTDEERDKKGRTLRRPAFQGRSKHELAGLMDIVCYYYMDTDEDDRILRKLLTAKTATTMAKDRSNRLPKPVMINPTMQDIYAAITSTEPQTETEETK